MPKKDLHYTLYSGNCSGGRVNIDCYGNTGGAYKGKVRVTRSGYECQYWNTTENYTKEGTHNYCRTPDKEGAGASVLPIPIPG